MKSTVVMIAAILGLLPAWSAEAVPAQLGDQDFASGTFHTSGEMIAAAGGDPAIFNSPCGSDTASNCNLGWTLNYTIPVNETITGATLTLGILDHDSAVAARPRLVLRDLHQRHDGRIDDFQT